jgi:hypothetical protein
MEKFLSWTLWVLMWIAGMFYWVAICSSLFGEHAAHALMVWPPGIAFYYYMGRGKPNRAFNSPRHWHWPRRNKEEIK